MPLRAAIEALTPDERRRLRAAGLTIGALDVFDARLLKPEGARRRRMLLALRDEMLPVPTDGATVLPRDAPAAMPAAGYRPLGVQAVRIDLVERIARQAHDARKGRAPFAPDPALAVEPEEQALFTALDRAEPAIAAALAAEDFAVAMVEMARLRAPVDAFFEAVLVNADDPALRLNRLRLLGRIREVMRQAAVWEMIEG